MRNRDRTQTAFLPITLEEIGRTDQVCIEATLEILCTPGERRVMYDRNGDGYPGSPPTFELVAVRVDSIEGLDWKIDRNRADWIKFAEAWVFELEAQRVDENEYQDDIAEALP